MNHILYPFIDFFQIIPSNSMVRSRFSMGTVLFRQNESSLFQAFIPEGQSIAVLIEKLAHAAIAIDKYEQGIRQGAIPRSERMIRTDHRWTCAYRKCPGIDKCEYRRSRQSSKCCQNGTEGRANQVDQVTTN
jgi:hypothetical protein